MRRYTSFFSTNIHMNLIILILMLSGCYLVDENNISVVTLSDGSKMLIEKDVGIPVRDGIRLSANVFRPLKPGWYPTIVAMTPYNKDWLPVEYEAQDGDINVSEYATFEQVDPDFWVANNYAVVSIDTRGSNLSEGDLALFTDQEAEDYYDAIEWLAEQEWSNGNIGLSGVSYMAVSQWKVAALSPPSLKAIMPWEGFTDIYRDALYHGGIAEIEFIPTWWKFRILANKNPDSLDQMLPQKISERPLLGTDNFYESLTPLNLENITVPAYIAASWPDHGLHTRGTILGFERIGSNNKWLDVHGRKKLESFYSEESQQRQLQFFDYFLAEKENGMLEEPRIKYEMRTAYYEGEPKTASDWPIPNSETDTFYLDAANNSLNRTLPINTEKKSYITGDNPQADLEEMSDRIEFTHTFTKPTEITGGMNLILWASVDGLSNDTDFFIGISKFDHDGQPVYFEGNAVENGLVANGWLRASHRALDTEKSNPIFPFHLHNEEQKLVKNEIIPVEIEILPSSTFFDEGERLTVTIQGTDIENSGVMHDSLSQGKVSIYTGAEYPSRLIFANIKQ